MIPLLQPSVTQAEIDEVVSALESHWWGSGPKVEKFEQLMATQSGYHHCVTVNSATAALHLSLKLFDIGPGDEVIVPALTFISSALAVVYCGATPIFADVRPDTLCIDWNDAREKITENTKAIIAVDYAGYPAKPSQMPGVAVVQDAAHACGGLYYGDLVTLSFHPVKNLATGDGGAILCRASRNADRLKALRWCGIDRSTWERVEKRYNWDYQINSVGYKCVHANTYIANEQGKPKRIMNIVNSQYSGTVLSMDNRGRIVPRRVVNWYKNELGDRKWVFLTHELAAKRKGYQSGSKPTVTDKRGVFITEDHPVLTINGYVKACNITANDLLVTANDDLHLAQYEFVVGTILGDSSIVRSGTGNANLSFTHSTKQSEWFDTRVAFLSNFNGTTRINKRMLTGYDHDYTELQYQSARSPLWTRLRERFYAEGCKIIPPDLVLSPRTLATWYMDDGSLNNQQAILCTDGFDKATNRQLINLLAESQIQAKLVRHTKHWRIAIQNSSDFFMLISPFIVPSMRYKLPSGNWHSYNHALWQQNWDKQPKLLSAPEVFFVDPPNRATHKVYCIEVEETHNFIVGGDIVIGNCHWNDIQAAIGLAQLRRLDDLNHRRREIAMRYSEELFDLVELPRDHEHHTWHLYPIRVDHLDRDDIIDHLRQNNISAGVHYKPLTHYPMFDADLPVTEREWERLVSLPIFYDLTEEQQGYVIDKIKEFYGA